MKKSWPVPDCRIEQVTPHAPAHLHITARGLQRAGRCPDCGRTSRKVHSRYQRRLADLPSLGRSVSVHVRVRRFYCRNIDCARRTFVERLPKLVVPFARRTCRLAAAQAQTGLALGGEASTRLLAGLSMPASADTVLRLIKAMPLPDQPAPRAVGIDDWAWRRGQNYGTILIDLERHTVIDLLPNREAAAVADWLKRRNGIEVVARDRAGAYAEAARQGAPHALQVADRWHLFRNLGEALQGVVDRHRRAVRQAARTVAADTAAPVAMAPTPVTYAERLRAERRDQRRCRYEEMLRLHQLGLPGHAIGRAVGASALTVYRWLKASGPPSHDKPEQPRNIAPHEAFLARRWAEGCRNGARLWRELRARGYQGGQRSVVRWATKQRRQQDSGVADAERQAAVWPVPSSRLCARLLGTPPDQLEAQERAFLDHLATVAPAVARAGELANAFAALLRAGRRSLAEATTALKAWMSLARGSLLDGFVHGLERDNDAVAAAIGTPWSSGPVEGQINRLKAIKRSAYGRAGFHLLRQRVLMAI
jgi:transposase